MGTNLEQIRAAQMVDNFNMHRQVRHQQRTAAQQKAIAELDQVEDSSLFKEQETKATANNVKFDKYIVLPSHLAATNEAGFNPDVISKLLNSYFDEKELNVMFGLFAKQNLTKGKADKILDALLEGDEDAAEGVLAGALKSEKFSMAEIFVLLSFLLSEVSKKDQKKKKLLSLLQNILKKINQQNSSYLGEFFSLADNPLVKQNPKLANGVANLASGEISLASLTETLQFITDYLDGDLTNLVSKCIRLRVHVLAKLTSTHLTFERKSELLQYTRCEKNLITVNSINLKVSNFKNVINANDLWRLKIATENMTIMRGVLTFVDVAMLTTVGLKNLLKALGINKDLNELIGFKNKLIQFLSEMPMEIYSNNSQRQKVIQGIRSIFTVVDADKQEAASLDFLLKPRKMPVKAHV